MARLNLVQTTAPTSEPLTVVQAREYLNVEDDSLDGLIENEFIPFARDYVEKYLDMQLMQASWTWKLTGFPACELIVPKPPLYSVTSIAYVDAAGSSQTVSSANYIVGSGHMPGIITPAYGVTWPTARQQDNAVTVVYVAGYASAAAIPPMMRIALRLLIVDANENRDGSGSAPTRKAANAILDQCGHWYSYS